MSASSHEGRPVPLDPRGVLSLVLFIAGPLIVPFIAPLLGGVLVGNSSSFTRAGRLLGRWAGVAPAIAAVMAALLTITVLTDVEQVFGSLALAMGVHVVPAVAGLALLLSRRYRVIEVTAGRARHVPADTVNDGQ